MVKNNWLEVKDCQILNSVTANGTTNGNTSGNCNGSTNGTTNGSKNGATNGATKGATNGNTNGNTNGSTNGTLKCANPVNTNGSSKIHKANGSTIRTSNGRTIHTSSNTVCFLKTKVAPKGKFKFFKRLFYKELLQKEPVFERIVQNGDSLLEEAEEGPEKEALRARLEVINSQWADIKSQTQTRKEYIDKLYPLCERFNDNYVLFSVFLEDSEKCLNGLHLSMDKEDATNKMEELQKLREYVQDKEDLLRHLHPPNDPIYITCKQINITKGLQEIQGDLDTIDTKWKELSDALAEKERDCEDILKTLSEFAERIKPLEEIVEEVMQLSKNVAQFGIDLTKGENTKAHIKTLKDGIIAGKPDLNQLRDEIPEILRVGGVVAEPVEEQFNALNVQLEECEQTLDELDNTLDKQLHNVQLFNEACDGLEEWVPTALQSKAITESVSFQPEDLLRQADDIKSLKKDIADHKKALERAHTTSMHILESNRNDKEGCARITIRVDNITNTLQQLENDLEEKERKFGSVNKYLDNYTKLKQPVEEFLTGSNDMLDGVEPFGLDTKAGAECLKELETLSHTLEKRKPDLRAVNRAGQSLIRQLDIYDKIESELDELSDNYYLVTDKTKEKVSTTKDCLHKATMYVELVETLQVWIKETLSLIECFDDKLETVDEEVVKEKLAKIQETQIELRKKLPELKEAEEIRDWFDMELKEHTPLTSEIDQLYETVRAPIEDDLPRKLNELESMLQSSLASSQHMMNDAEEVDRWLCKMEETMDDQSPVSALKETNYRQLMELNYIQQQLESHQEKFDQIVRECADTDLDPKIREKLSEQSKRWNIVLKKCSLRKGTLNKVSEVNKKLDEDFDVALPSVDDVEKKLSNFGSISVNRETLQGQVKLVATMLKVLDGVRDAASRLCDSERTLHDSAEVEREIVTTKVDDFTTRYNNLEGLVRNLNDRLTEMSKVQQSMEEKTVVIEDACVEAESQLLSLDAPDTTDGPTSTNEPSKRDKLRNILNELMQRSPESTDIRTNAKDILDIDSSTDNVHTVEDVVGGVSKKFADTVRSLQDKIEEQEKKDESLGKFMDKMGDIETKTGGVEKKLKDLPPVGDNVKEQLIQVEELQCEVADIGNLMNEAGAFRDDIFACEATPDQTAFVEDKLSSADARVKGLEDELNTREGVLKEKLQESGNFNEQLDDFMRRANNIEQKVDQHCGKLMSMKPAGLASTMDALERLSLEVVEETPIHVDILEKGNKLLSGATSPQEKEQLQKKLDDLDSQWKNIVHKVEDEKKKKGDLLEKSKQLEELVDKVEKVAQVQQHKLQTLDPITCSAEKLGEQQNDSKAMLSEVDSTKPLVEQVAALMSELEPLCEEAPIDIQHKLDESQQKLHHVEDAANQRLTDIATVQDLMEQYLSLSRPLKEKLTKLEKTVSKHTLYGLDKQQSAQVQEEVAKQLKAVDALKCRASELTEVVESMQSQPDNRKYDNYVTEGEDITRRVDDLKNDLLNKSSEIDDVINEWNELEGEVKQLSNNVDVLEGKVEANKVNLLQTESLHHNIDNMSDVLAEVQAVKPKYEDLKKRARKLLEKGVGGELCGEVLPNIDDKVRSMQREIPDRMKELDKLSHALERFEHKLKETGAEVGDVEKCIEEQQPIGGDKEVIEPQMTSLRELIEKVDQVNTKVTDLKEEGTGMTNKYPDAQSESIDEPIRELVDRVNAASCKVSERQVKLEEALVQCGQFNDAIGALVQWLEETSELIQNQKPVSGVDHNVLKAQLQEQKLLMRMFADRESSVATITKNGEDLLANTEDETTKAEIQHNLDKVNTLWHSLTQQVAQRKDAIEETVVVAEKFNTNLKLVATKLDELQEKVKQDKLPSAKLPIVHEQIEAAKELVLECNEVQSLVEGVQKDMRNLEPFCTQEDRNVVRDKYTKLYERFEDVADNCDGKKHNLTRACDLLDVFYDKQTSLSHWLNDMESELKGVEPNEGDVGKVKKLQKDLKDRKPDVVGLSELAVELKNIVRTEEYEEVSVPAQQVDEKYKHLKSLVDETAREMIMEKEKIQVFELKLNGLKEWTNDQMNRYHVMAPIDVCPDPIKEQVHEHQAFTIEVNSKEPQFIELYELGETILLVCDEEEGPAFGDRIDNLKFNKQQLDKVTMERHNLLVEALLLSQQFCDIHKDLASRLTITEDLLKQVDEEKGRGVDIQKEKLQNIVANISHLQPLIDSVQRTGADLITIGGNSDNARTIEQAIADCLKRWEKLKASSEDKGIIIEAAKEQVEAVWNDLEILMEKLQELKEKFKAQSPVPVHEELIAEESVKLKELEDILEVLESPVVNMNNSINNILEEDPNSPFSTSLKDRQRKLGNVWKFVKEACEARKKVLEESTDAATKFWLGLNTLKDTLLDVQTKMSDEMDPGLESDVIDAILAEHNELHLHLDRNENIISVLAEVTPCLVNHATQEDKIDVYKKLTSITEQWDGIEAAWAKRTQELEQLKEITAEFLSEVERVDTWLDEAEICLKDYTIIPSDLMGLKNQLRQLRVFHRELAKHQNEITRLTQKGDVLAEKVNDEGQETVKEILDRIHKRWESLLDQPYETQQLLEEALLERGHLGYAIEELLIWIEQTKGSLESTDIDIVKDKKSIEVEMSKLRVISNDVAAHRVSVSTCQTAVRNTPQPTADLENRMADVNNGWEDIQELLKQREEKLDGALEDSKNFQNLVHESLQWLNDSKVLLKSSGPYGAKVEVVAKQLDEHKEFMKEVESREIVFVRVLETFDALIQSSDMSSARILEVTLYEIKTAWTEVRALSDKVLNELTTTLSNAQKLEHLITEIEIWIVRVEGTLSLFTNVSTLLDLIKDQISEFDVIYCEVTEKRELFRSLRKTAENVVDKCLPEDAEAVNTELESLSKKWKNLNNKLKDRKKMIDENYEQSKVFFEGHEQLMTFLDEVERKIMGDQSVGKDAQSVKSQMRKHKEFQNELGKKQTKLNIIVKAGKSLQDKSIPEEIEVIGQNIAELVTRWDSVCVLSVERQHELENALLFHGMFQDAVHALLEWINSVEPTMVSETAIMGDTDTVKLLLDNHKTFMRDFAKREKNYESILKTGEAMLAEDKVENVEILNELLEKLKTRWQSLTHTSHTKQERLTHAYTLANEFKDGCMNCVNNLADLEDELKQQGPVAEDVVGINKMLEEFAEFQERLDTEEVHVNACLKKGEVILRFCHPSSLHTVRHQVAIVKKRWTDVSGWARLRKQRLDDGMHELIEEEKVAQVLMEWISQTEGVLDEREQIPLPQEYNLLVQLLNEHQATLSESEKKQIDYGKITKRAKRKPLSHADRHSTPRKASEAKAMREFANPMISNLSKRWQKLWLILLERRRRIEEKLEEIRIMKASAEFNWEDWRVRYNQWLVESKSRVLDMWRKKDVDRDNKLTRDQFVHGLSDTSFPSERWEIELVFDKIRRGLLITYDDFLDALKGRKRKPDKPKTESEEIHDIIGSEVAKCCCAHKFSMSKVAEGKYRFGDQQKLRLVRILRSQVMVRVGGGWVSLVEFLEKNDPCRETDRIERLKNAAISEADRIERLRSISEADRMAMLGKAAGATNYQLRENIIRPDHASEGMQAFKNKSPDKSRRQSPAVRPSLSREGSGSGIPILKVKREKSGLSRSRDESDGHCHHSHGGSHGSHGSPKKLATPMPSMTRKKSDMEREGSNITIPKYKKETYVGRSSGYGVTHPTTRKKKESAAVAGTPPRSSASTPPSKTETDKGDVYSRLYGTQKTRRESSKPTSPGEAAVRRTSSIKGTTPDKRTSVATRPSPLATDKPAVKRGASTKTSKPTTPTTKEEEEGVASRPPTSPATRGSVFERLSTQGTATRRASSLKEPSSTPSAATSATKKTTTPKRTASAKK